MEKSTNRPSSPVSRLLSAVHRLALNKGLVIPAHPLALKEDRSLDEEAQRRLTRYYLESGVGGIAVGVHTTQFEIRNPKHRMFERVLELASDEVNNWEGQPVIRIAGVCGPVEQAVEEAQIARELQYDMVLLSPGGLKGLSEDELLYRAERVGKVLPLFGFYLQPAVGGMVLSEYFWRAFSELESVYAIKIAPFNRYQTQDVVRAVCLSSRCDEIALYTGNDDNIVIDLLTTFEFDTPRGIVRKEIVGGLLGHWAVWTSKAVELLQQIHLIKSSTSFLPHQLLTDAVKITDANAAFFDAANQFKGCIAGIHEVLRRQGLMQGIWCLDPEEGLSEGQLEEIERIYREYPDLNDDGFVQTFLHEKY